MRFFMVLAALLVNVTARILDKGQLKALCIQAIRHTRVNVLPLPAPAMMSWCPGFDVAALYCASLSVCIRSFIFCICALSVSVLGLCIISYFTLLS